MTKAIFLDIDGCIFEHRGNLSTQYDSPILLSGVIQKINKWNEEGHMIILVTGRKECMREITEKQLSQYGVFYDKLIMGLPRGERVIINDKKPEENISVARAIELQRNEGLLNVQL